MKGSGKRRREDEGRLQPTIDSLRVFVELGDRLRAAAGQGTSYASLSKAAEGMAYSKSNVFRAVADLYEVYGRRALVNRNTITLLDAALAYHREVTRQASGMPPEVELLLPRLRDPRLTRVLLVTLPEATPVHEAAKLQEDLRRAEIRPFAWVINQSLTPLNVSDPVLMSRQAQEAGYIREVIERHATRVALVPWQEEAPVGADRLRELAGGRKTMAGTAG